MNQLGVGMRAWHAAVALFLLWAGTAVAQDDPFGDDFEDEPDAEEAAPEDTAPEEGAPPEGEPEEPVEPVEPVEPEPLEGEALGEELPPEPIEADAAPAPVASGTGSEMVVTGSRIRRSEFAQPSAVQIVDREQLMKSGATNMTDVIKNMNINAGSLLNPAVSSASPGSAQFNLRGLGISSTLVLLNGRRLPLSGALTQDGNPFVDINSIPIGIIERIEVLKGGASAIYGSDAVAGVVNIITRKHMDGFEAQVGGQTTDDFDHHEWDVALMGGAQGERTRVTGAVSYFKREPLLAADREFTNNFRNVSALGWPSAFLKIPPTPVNVPPAPTKFDSFQDPGCGDVNLSAPSMDPARRLDLCTFNFNPYFMLMPNDQRLNLYLTVEHDLGDHVMMFAEAGYARSRAYRTVSPSYPLLTTFIVPADHAYNPTGQPLRWYGRPLGGNSPPDTNYFDSDTLHTVAGVLGDFGGLVDGGDDWEWELAGTWSGNRFQTLAPDFLAGPLRDAINSCGPGHDPADCYNPFSFGAPNSSELVDRVRGQLRGKTDTELTTLNLDLTGPLFELPGGDLSMAVGAQVRRETAQVDPDHDSNIEAYTFLVGGPDWQAERRILAGFGELLMPFFDGFELQAAGRIEDYDDVGSTFDPMFGFTWTPATTFAGPAATPAAKVRLRGTYSKSFRAPSLLQTNGAATELTEIFPYSNVMGMPQRATSGVFTAVRTFGNPDLVPQRSTAITAGLEWAPAPGLTLEGDYWNYDYKNIIVKENAQALVASDWMNMDNPQVVYDAAGGIQRVNVLFINAEEVMTHGIDVGINYRSDFGAEAGTFSFGATGTYVLAYEIPQSAVASEQWDEEHTDCSAPLTDPAMDAPAGATCDVAGSRNVSTFAGPLPRLRATVPLSWNLEGHTAALTVNYISSYSDDFNSGPTNMPPTASDYRTIDAFMTLDLQYSLRLQETEFLATTFRVGVTNLLDTDPPAVNTGYGYDALTHDPRGRLIYGRLIQEF